MKDREASLKEIDETLDRIVDTISWRNPDLVCRRTKFQSKEDTRVLVQNRRAGIKIETSPVARGTLEPPERMAVSPVVIERFGFAEANVVGYEELYAGKLVAALDRQHPRDLFDVKLMYDYEGFTEKLFKVFLVYLAGSGRPMHELLAPHARIEDSRMDAEFVGMTVEPVSKETLITTQRRLHEDIRDRLVDDVATFLLSLHDAEPDFDLLGFPDAYRLPAIKWKVRNLERLKADNPRKHVEQREELMKLLH